MNKIMMEDIVHRDVVLGVPVEVQRTLWEDGRMSFHVYADGTCLTDDEAFDEFPDDGRITDLAMEFLRKRQSGEC